MRLTRTHLNQVFPTLRDNLTTDLYQRTLKLGLVPFTNNWEYAEDMARAIMSHVRDEPYTALPSRIIAHRAIIDTFTAMANDVTAPSYIRAICTALERSPKPRSFRRYLVQQAKKKMLDFPASLEVPDDGLHSRVIRIRMPDLVYRELEARCKAKGLNLSDYMRQLIYTAKDM